MLYWPAMKSMKPAIALASVASLLFVGTGTALARVDVSTMLRERVERVAQPVQQVLPGVLVQQQQRTKAFVDHADLLDAGPSQKNLPPFLKMVNGIAVFSPHTAPEDALSDSVDGIAQDTQDTGAEDTGAEDAGTEGADASAGVSGSATPTSGSASAASAGAARAVTTGVPPSSGEDASGAAGSATADTAPTAPTPVSAPASTQLPRIAGPGKGANDIRIHISGFSATPEISGTGSFAAYSGPFQVGTFSAGERVSVRLDGSDYVVNVRGNEVRVQQPVRFAPTSGVLQIANFNNAPAWNPAYNDNVYRGKLEVVAWGGRPIVVNELNLEDYMKGLAEMTNASPLEKSKAITIAARSYAKFYMINGGKFAGPYDLDDSPARSQKYLGYGYEQRAGNVTAAVNATRGMVLAYNGVIVKAPYFSQSDGVATRSALDVWGWNHTPYLVSVDDSACTTSNGAFAGHGVGMSGCGAHGMAVQGASYQQILQHYYTGIQILDLY